MTRTPDTTPKRRPKQGETKGLERLGGGESWVTYAATGGRCSVARCREDAPKVMLHGKEHRLPCAKHAEKALRDEEALDRRSRAVECMAQSGLTERMREWSFETYREGALPEGLAAATVAEKWMRDYLRAMEIVRFDNGEPVRRGGRLRNLRLWGPVGTGKTLLAACLVRALCEDGHKARIVNFAALLETIKDCYARHIPASGAIVSRVPVLVLDDVGAESPTDWACALLLGIVDYRYEHGLPTVFVSNYAPADLVRRLGKYDETTGQRIVSRMAEGAAKFEFTGDDRRRAAA